MRIDNPRRDTITGYDFTLDEALPLPVAIRLHCIECKGGSVADVRKCQLTECPFHRFRSGIAVGNGISRRKAVRKNCLDCQCGSRSGVADCQITDCHLWSYRMGKKVSIGQKAVHGDIGTYTPVDALSARKSASMSRVSGTTALGSSNPTPEKELPKSVPKQRVLDDSKEVL